MYYLHSLISLIITFSLIGYFMHYQNTITPKQAQKVAKELTFEGVLSRKQSDPIDASLLEFIPLEIKSTSQNQSNRYLTTDYSQRSILVYNRVPKCASGTTNHLLKMMKKVKTKLQVPFWSNPMNKFHLKELCVTMDQIRTQVPVVIGHFFHVEWQDFCGLDQGDQVVWMNQIRHPVSRFISYYYFQSSPEMIRRKFHLGRNQTNPMKMSIERCVLEAQKECNFTQGAYNKQVMSFFCGQARECSTIGSFEALQKAKQVVEEQYAVIGIQEDYDRSLLLYEKVLPQFFNSIQSAYVIWKSAPFMMHQSRSNHTVPQSVLAILNRNMSLDIDFYAYVKSRFYVHLDHFNIEYNHDML